MIDKKPTKVSNFKTHMLAYNSARNAFKDLLGVLKRNNDLMIYLPAYIGISPKEGSGIFDPICELGIQHEFYRLDRNLCVCVDELIKQIKNRNKNKTTAILLVHYFGYIDPNYDLLSDVLKSENVIIIEDCAHAMFSHLVDEACGKGDYFLYSLHKMLPYSQGGVLNVPDANRAILDELSPENESVNVFEYDLLGIARKRKENAEAWKQLCSSLNIETIKLATNLKCTPQTYPILVNEEERYKIYQNVNELGFGVISLYHTMIDELKSFEAESSQYVSKRILNLPVHQDVNIEDINEMFRVLEKQIDN
ncbi:DegT/DnrJ/EryC1/StrS family aminotransferase [Butyrivibrio sp.]|jgi:dTDP-4-amino-4,6-dideoxygalactose transaminase|uniref:DegT/DnrJ/EryC1/StrS family aminotransferase n=1 Tax=Butyrivibrio sp. TaxID=28121 RepID=UPI0025BE657C|nr:DegT/DnrJ/EryC1/StrS family aminotransferase [Butyrivibrio sp.]MBE5837079.1 DegT/DnrJ/EryC1/StrS aminotransferase family protein [Butyrivibrio sp.]